MAESGIKSIVSEKKVGLFLTKMGGGEKYIIFFSSHTKMPNVQGVLSWGLLFVFLNNKICSVFATYRNRKQKNIYF
jgi:hypothetical protein